MSTSAVKVIAILDRLLGRAKKSNTDRHKSNVAQITLFEIKIATKM